MAGARETIRLKSTGKGSSQVYTTTKNKKQTPDRLELKKYDKTLKKHVIFKEAKS